MTKQLTSRVLMIRPACFSFNEETAHNNAFQTKPEDNQSEMIKNQAIQEFDQLVQKLRDHDIEVLVIQDTESPIKPDAVFPNNWISLHANGSLITYPMYAPKRRIERRSDIIEQLKSKFEVKEHWALESYEEKGLILEGTGSLIPDRDHEIVYACYSPRTNDELLEIWCEKTGYQKVGFTSLDQNEQEIYHTNVMMAVGVEFVVICMESIIEKDRNRVKNMLENSGKKIIDISFEQVNAFAGNMLQLKSSKTDKTYLLMSTTAYHSLEKGQIEQLEAFTTIIHSDIPTIERIGGGSVRCMVAENFLPLKS